MADPADSEFSGGPDSEYSDAPEGPVASVVITNHDYGRYVGAAITSAVEQTARCEVIVVDDGSTDDSLAVIEAHRAANPNLVRVVAKGNGGQASAFNAGWAMVSPGSPVVMFLDGDDVLDGQAVERVSAHLARQPDSVRCQFRLRWIDEHGRPMAGGFPEADRALPSGDLRSRMGRSPDDIPWQPTSGNAFTAAVLRCLLPMPEQPYRISADHYLSNVSALYGPVSAIESELGSYRIHGRNADHRSGFDLRRAREILLRSTETHRLLLEHGARLGLAMPDSVDGYRSLTTAGLRLTSFRLDRTGGQCPGPGAHPFPGDDRRSLLLGGLGAAWGRCDFTPARRLAAMAWIGLLAVAPRRLVPVIAARALTR